MKTPDAIIHLYHIKGGILLEHVYDAGNGDTYFCKDATELQNALAEIIELTDPSTRFSLSDKARAELDKRKDDDN